MPSAATHSPPADDQADRVLRRRVKLLGGLLGEVLQQHADPRVFPTVERLRRGYIRLRDRDDPRLGAAMARIIDGLDPATAEQVIRAFSTYFSLVNVAEEVALHDRRQRFVHSGAPLWPGSFDATVRQLGAEGFSAAEARELLGRIEYMPVFTAHPTESKRRVLLEAQRRIFLLLQETERRDRSAVERAETRRRLQVEISCCGAPTRCGPARRRCAPRSSTACTTSSARYSRPCRACTATSSAPGRRSTPRILAGCRP